MKIYLAGGVTAGNLNAFWKNIMKIHLAGTLSRPFVIEESMKVYIAGGNIGYKWAGDYNNEIINNKPYILESYYYIKNNNKWIIKMRPYFKDFLLDSGAFTYMSGKGDKVDWNKYIEQYADFIKTHDVDYYFELDIDSIVGYDKVKQLRGKLETLTNKPCIPVWHKSRGLDEFKKMAKDYDYIAIGGIVTQEIKRTEYDIFKPLLKIAKENNCKVHGLGFTNLKGLHKYKFYSVDSTAWLYGNRGGYLYKFNGKTIDKIQPKNMRLKGREAALHNFQEWLKFSKYAEQNL